MSIVCCFHFVEQSRKIIGRLIDTGNNSQLQQPHTQHQAQRAESLTLVSGTTKGNHGECKAVDKVVGESVKQEEPSGCSFDSGCTKGGK